MPQLANTCYNIGMLSNSLEARTGDLLFFILPSAGYVIAPLPFRHPDEQELPPSKMQKTTRRVVHTPKNSSKK